MKLLSMIGYIEHISSILNKSEFYSEDKCLQMEACELYAEFLSMPLTLSMFVPCDENGIFLEKPKQKEHWTSEGFGGYSTSITELEQYQKSISNVIFKGFEYKIHRAYPHVSNKRLEFIFDEYGCWLCPYDSCEAKRINSIEQLTFLNLSLDHLSLNENITTKYNI